MAIYTLYMYRIYMLLNNFDTENVSITRGEGLNLRFKFFSLQITT